jgi:hypothetical protein
MADRGLLQGDLFRGAPPVLLVDCRADPWTVSLGGPAMPIPRALCGSWRTVRIWAEATVPRRPANENAPAPLCRRRRVR